MKWIDMPPVWLLGFCTLAWLQAAHLPYGLGFPGPVFDLAGGLLVGGGLVLIVLAAWQFRRAKTTIIPGEVPARLVTDGIFSKSRNPIYLGDLLILAGLIVRWDAVLSLPLIPIFLWVIERRFVIPEENRMRREFRMEFARYCQATRRWI